MTKIYTGFSNYNEINAENRKKSAEEEVDLWGWESERFKEYRHKWNKAATENYLPEHPLHVDIELSDACNLQCKMCVHGFGTSKNVGFMDEKLTRDIIAQCAEIGVCSIKFNWRGEAALNKYLPEAVKFAKEKGILEVQFNTNGLPPKQYHNILIQCAENGLDRIIFSVDGFSKETYESIRIGGDYDALLKNIHQLRDWKKTNNAAKPFVRIQMVRSKENAHEVDDFIAYWKPLVNDVRISDIMDRGQGGQLAVGDQVTTGRARCPQPFQRMIVAKDGRVSPCCGDWDQEYILGDAKEEGLLDLWTGEKSQYLREIQNKKELNTVAICKKCYVKESYTWKKV
ncbi:MAG: radical SAM protein [bacterium]|nr:radical SAM protein [bacterium]